MAKSFIALAILISCVLPSGFASAQSNDVCTWRNSIGYAMSTNGYSWGGSTFSTLKECGIVLRATLMYLNFGQKDFSGIVRFTDPTGQSTVCSLAPVVQPFLPPTQEYTEVMDRASSGQSSVAEIAQYEDYLDQNLELTCGN